MPGRGRRAGGSAYPHGFLREAMMRHFLIGPGIGLGLAAFVVGGKAQATDVDLELVLLADASRSIDAAEIAFQRRGYAEAMASDEVLDAIGRGFLGRIAVTYVEWGSADSQDVVVPWTIVEGETSAAAFGAALLAAPRQAFGPNAIGSAIAAGQALIEGNDVDGYRKVIDLSADSASSFGGIPLELARQSALMADITINGLAVLCRAADCSGRPTGYDLEAAFAERIIGGPGSFVVTVEGPDQFAEAVRRKLVLEIADLGGTTP
jgi:hypothetical protein